MSSFCRLISMLRSNSTGTERIRVEGPQIRELQNVHQQCRATLHALVSQQSEYADNGLFSCPIRFNPAKHYSKLSSIVTAAYATGQLEF